MPKAATPARPFQPDYAVPPGETIADLLEQRGMTQTELARRLGVSLKHTNQIVNGAASLSAELALGLEKVFGVPADFWLNRESHFRSDLARQQETQELSSAIEWAERFPLAELKKRGFIPRASRGPQLVADLLRFLGIASPSVLPDPAVVYRKSLKVQSDPYALHAWLRCGQLEAEEIECEPYKAERFEVALKEVRSLTRLDPTEWHPRLVRTCADAGVAVVVVDTFTGARANGATRWISPTKAVIQLSLRYKWEDIFWFSFFHEAAHVTLHRKKHLFVDGLTSRNTEIDPELNRLEREADRFAARSLIPAKYAPELRYLTLADIPAFAKRLKIAPAIVVGRLQHEGLIAHNSGNNLRRRLEFVEQ